jgi:hypothetical protein
VSRLALAVAASLLAAGPASAQQQRDGESPRWGSLTLRAQTYRPDVDSEFTGATPYKDIFGSGRGWMFRADFGRNLWDQYGTLEIAIGSGFFTDSGKGIQTGTTTPTAQTTSFRIIPVTLSLGYRFDWLARRYGIPFMVYGKASLERYNWWVTGIPSGTAQKGATNGYSFTGGVGFNLNFLDPGAGREMDRDIGINDTWVVFDVTKSVVDDFGSKKSWILSDASLSLGMGLLFVF